MHRFFDCVLGRTFFLVDQNIYEVRILPNVGKKQSSMLNPAPFTYSL